MEQWTELLVSRLSDKGVVSSHVPGLMRDVRNIVREGGYFTVGNVNNRLESLGWGGDILDEWIFELILSVHEKTATVDR